MLLPYKFGIYPEIHVHGHDHGSYQIRVFNFPGDVHQHFRKIIQFMIVCHKRIDLGIGHMEAFQGFNKTVNHFLSHDVFVVHTHNVLLQFSGLMSRKSPEPLFKTCIIVF